MAERVEEEFTFLSYSRKDERFALRFARDLCERGIDVWVDQLSIKTSEHWDRAVEQAIHECSAMIVILSPRAVRSDNVADEVSLAIEAGKTIIPIMIETCRMPLRLTRRHVINATSSYEAALTQCLAAIKHASIVEVDSCATPNLTEQTVLLQSVAAQLASIMGPIARILVEDAARRADSARSLYGMLSLHIDDPKARETFLALQPRLSRAADGHEARTAVAPADVARVARVLTRYLGPIAPLIAKRESRLSTSFKDLLHRLAAMIRSEQDRNAFYRQVGTG